VAGESSAENAGNQSGVRWSVRAKILGVALTAVTVAIAVGVTAPVLFSRTRAETEKVASDGLRPVLQGDRAGYIALRVTDVQNLTSAGRTIVTVLLLIGVVSAMLLAIRVAGRVVKAVSAVSAVLSALANGNLTRSVGKISNDELGVMAGLLDRSTAALRRMVSSVGEHANGLATSSEGLARASSQIAGSVRETSTRSAAVSASAGQVSDNVQTVAAGSEEMTAAISEIAQSTAQAADVARQAVTAAANADAIVGKLGDSSTEIGNVVKLITSIAEQTNLLALNATIEAARAGDTGKGFAVVAGEVKELAQETATENIAQRISGIQQDSTQAVTAIREITTVIDQINSYQTTIASAVEEQTATTNEMSRSVSHAAAAAGEIAHTRRTTPSTSSPGWPANRASWSASSPTDYHLAGMRPAARRPAIVVPNCEAERRTRWLSTRSWPTSGCTAPSKPPRRTTTS
jgi:methyl-accepting chemotaxis protein